MSVVERHFYNGLSLASTSYSLIPGRAGVGRPDIKVVRGNSSVTSATCRAGSGNNGRTTTSEILAKITYIPAATYSISTFKKIFDVIGREKQSP